MKKFMFMALAAIAAFSSCSNEEEIAQVAAESNDVVSFGAYNLGQSRSKIETIESIKDNGFGVFAFSQMAEPIASYSKSNFMPNFMYNQKVSYDAGGAQWIYSPVKYWPNNPGAMVSFYAYAPYFPEFSADANTQTPETNEYLNVVNPIAEKNVRLILGYDYNGPGIEYTRSEIPTEGVDLMWGEYIKDKGQAGTVAGSGKDSGAAGTATGTAAVDVDKQKVEESVFFQFHHALSRVNFNIQVWADKTPNPNEADQYHMSDNLTELAPGTTIKIRKVELIGNIPNKGTLRLYDGSWNVEKNDFSNLVLTEEHFSAAVQAGLKADDAAKEIDLLTGTGFMNADGTEKDTKVDLGVDNYLMLIPGFGTGTTKFYIQITYDVITEDPANPKNSSIVTNVVKSTDINALAGDPTDGGNYELKAGLAYNFHLNIGMTSVKFSADVDEWDVVSPEVVLPKNY